MPKLGKHVCQRSESENGTFASDHIKIFNPFISTHLPFYNKLAWPRIRRGFLLLITRSFRKISDTCMTLLHELFITRNIQDFQRLLDANIDRRVFTVAPSSPSGVSKSWTRSAGFISVDVNARDRMGRTALHLASSSLESIEYVRALLKHPNIDPNLMDSESHWTALHRALYCANIPAVWVLSVLRLFYKVLFLISNIDYFFCNARMSTLLSRILKGIPLLICTTPRSMIRNRMRTTSGLSCIPGVLIGTPAEPWRNPF